MILLSRSLRGLWNRWWMGRCPMRSQLREFGRRMSLLLMMQLPGLMLRRGKIKGFFALFPPEAKLKAKVPVIHPMICWLIEHSADALNEYQKGDGGRTAYHRLSSKIWNDEMVAFGEKVQCRINRKALTKEYKLDGRWYEEYFMGVKWRTGESWIATSGGILKASAIRRVCGHRRWDAEGLLQVKGVHWDHVQKGADPGEVCVRWLDPSLLPSQLLLRTMAPREDVPD